ncbi:MAG: TonB-dependent receptor [Gammaproteobacteria bacterium]|jgi:Fe(3+) dicitrate transport protein
MPSRFLHSAAACLSLLALAGPGSAQEPATDDPSSTSPPALLDSVTIVGSQAAARRTGGSAYYLGPQTLQRFDYGDVLRVIRSVPGVYVQDEEGYGLRPNIGIRGSGLDRSGRIALLEDGVLIAPAPYASPSAYYFPTQRRMSGVEVLKGPAAVRVGPRTTGGAVNLLSTPMPSKTGAQLDVTAGQNDSREAYGWAAYRNENVGLFFETVQQETDGFKNLDPNDRNSDTGFDLEDYFGKLLLTTDQDARWYQGLEVKWGFTDQNSNASYLGLTDEDYDDDPFRRYAASQIDNIQSNHYHRQATWFLAPNTAPWDVSVTVYDFDFDRNWYKLQSVGGSSISNILDDPDDYAAEMDWIRGGDSPDDTLVLRNNNRDYYSRGIQGRGSYDLGTWPVTVRAGFRFHEDEEDRFQSEDGYRMESGTMFQTSNGAPGSQTNRVSDGSASAGYLETEVRLGDWQFTPGLRYEDITLTRKDYATDDPGREDGPTRTRSNRVTEWIPGLAALWQTTPRLSLLGGVSKGFNPPGPGSESDPEESINYEFGGRYGREDLFVEAIGFYTDYENLVGTVTESTGGGGDIGAQFDGGEAHVTGLELLGSYRYDGLGRFGLEVPVELNWTWTAEAEFDNSFESDYDPWGVVESGDELPYIPEHQGRLYTGLLHRLWQLNLNVTYTDKVRTRAGSGSLPSDEATDNAVVVDLAAAWHATRWLDVVLRVDNLFDEDYIVARRPAGVRPGRDRTAMLGLRMRL